MAKDKKKKKSLLDKNNELKSEVVQLRGLVLRATARIEALEKSVHELVALARKLYGLRRTDG
jgi:hypothetical protein